MSIFKKSLYYFFFTSLFFNFTLVSNAENVVQGEYSKGDISTDIDNFVKNIDPKIAYEMFQNESKDLVFVDIRKGSEYELLSIPFSILISKSNFALNYEHHKDLFFKKKIILISKNGTEGWQFMDFISQFGYKNVYNLEGGIIEWKRAKLPINEKEISMSGKLFITGFVFIFAFLSIFLFKTKRFLKFAIFTSCGFFIIFLTIFLGTNNVLRFFYLS